MSAAAKEVVSLNEIKKQKFKDYSTLEIFEDNTSALKHTKSDHAPVLRHEGKFALHLFLGSKENG